MKNVRAVILDPDEHTTKHKDAKPSRRWGRKARKIESLLAASSVGHEYSDASLGHISHSEAETLVNQARRLDGRSSTHAQLPADLRAPSIGRQYQVSVNRYLQKMMICDTIVGIVAFYITLEFLSTTPLGSSITVQLFVLGGLIWPIGIAAARGYDRRAIKVGAQVRPIVRTYAVLMTLLAVTLGLGTYTPFTLRNIPLGIFVLAITFAALLSMIVRSIFGGLLNRHQRTGRVVRRVLIVGGAAAARSLALILSHDSKVGTQVVGLCVPESEHNEFVSTEFPVLGTLGQVRAVTEDFACDLVVVTTGNSTRFADLRQVSGALEGSGVEMLVDPGLISVAGSKIEVGSIAGLPLLHLAQSNSDKLSRVVKRCVDVVGSVVGLVALAPLFLVIAFLIKITDPAGPVLYRQQRLGRGGRSINIFRFRSMMWKYSTGPDRPYQSAEEAFIAMGRPDLAEEFAYEQKLATDDPRVSRLGRFLRKSSLDELPELMNVLMGHLSLVGPRPITSAELAHFGEYRNNVLTLKPGLTGLWQVSGGSKANYNERVELDLFYADNWTNALDAVIIGRAFAEIVRRNLLSV